MTAAAVTDRLPRRRGTLRLLAHQVRYEQLSFWRNPQSAVFTFVFPVVFIAIMGALFGGAGRSPYFDGLTALQYYVPTIAALSVLGSCYGQLAVALAARRQNGILKRVRATPLPAWAYFAGLLAHCVLVSVVDIALIVAVGAAVRRAVAVTLARDRAHAGARRGQLLRAGRRGRVGDRQRRGRPGGRPARPVPAAVHLRHLHADSLRAAEPGRGLASGAPLQRGADRPVRRAHRR